MTAAEAKKLAANNLKQIEELKLVKKNDLLEQQCQSLREYFETKMDKAIKEGHFYTDPMEFELGRFPDDVVRVVAQELKDKGFYVQSEKNNAFQRVKYTISWS